MREGTVSPQSEQGLFLSVNLSQGPSSVSVRAGLPPQLGSKTGVFLHYPEINTLKVCKSYKALRW